METTLIITDVTRMGGARVCVAGISTDGFSIRPVVPFPGLQEDWLYEGTQVIVRPFALVTFDLLHHDPRPPHTEDWFIRPGIKCLNGQLNEDEKENFLARIVEPDVAAIFQAGINEGRYIHAGEGTCSLGTICANSINFITYNNNDDGAYEYRITFSDESGNVFNLPVTDLSFRYYLNDLHTRRGWSCRYIGLFLHRALSQATTYLRIGLTRGWNRNPNQPQDRCYLQINGVYSFPDFLDGRCFADFHHQPVNEEVLF